MRNPVHARRLHKQVADVVIPAGPVPGAKRAKSGAEDATAKKPPTGVHVEDARDTGMEMQDLFVSPDFLSRDLGHRDPQREIRALRRIAEVLAERPENALQSLVEIAVEECHGDSSGVSLEEPSEERFRWVVVAGSFSQYLNGTTPRNYSPCGTCLDRGAPLHYRLTKPYYDFLGVTADPILDGILIPWHGDKAAGTIWLVSHRSRVEFDQSDYELLKMIADIVASAYRYQSDQRAERRRDVQDGRDIRSDELAHAINNPLQGISNSIFLVEQDPGKNAEYLGTAAQELRRLSELVASLLGNRRNREG